MIIQDGESLNSKGKCLYSSRNEETRSGSLGGERVTGMERRVFPCM